MHQLEQVCCTTCSQILNSEQYSFTVHTYFSIIEKNRWMKKKNRYMLEVKFEQNPPHLLGMRACDVIPSIKGAPSDVHNHNVKEVQSFF